MSITTGIGFIMIKLFSNNAVGGGSLSVVQVLGGAM